MDPIAEVLARHYQKSFELTYEHWRQRNRIFLYLLVLTAAATLLIASPSEGHPLLLAWLLKNLGVIDPNEIARLGPLSLFSWWTASCCSASSI